MIKFAILSSSRGTHLSALQQAIQDKILQAQIAVVLSNKEDAQVLQRAQDLKIPNHFLSATKLTRENYDERVSQYLQNYKIELIVLIGYMRILSKKFVDTWARRIINVHPSLLPAHAGKMDLNVHRAVLAANEPESGCTVHYVTEEVDAGPVILQARCPVRVTDTPETLKARVQILEAQALINTINQIAYSHSSTAIELR